MQRILAFSTSFLRFLSGSLFLILSLSASVSPVSANQGRLWLSSSAEVFGNVAVGSSKSLSLQLANTGSAVTVFSQGYVKGSGFSLIGFTLPVMINYGHSMVVIVKFAPTTAGPFNGQLVFTSNATNSSITLSLSGTGVGSTSSSSPGSFSATPTAASFSNVPVGTSNTQSVTLKNVGGSSATVNSFSSSGSTFTVKGLTVPQTIAAGQSTSFQVVFDPTQSTQYSGTLTLNVNTTQKTLAIPLSGAGVTGSRIISVSPNALNFGSLSVGAQSTAKVQLQNPGNSTLTVSSVTISGTGFSANGVASGLAIPTGQSAVLNVEFSPTTAGAKSGTVTINSNASTPVMTVALSGSGVAASSHSVQLSWMASSSSGVVGYNIYRGSSSSGSFAKLNSSTIAGLSFADSTVQAGQTYSYEVTTVSSNGVESAPCSPVTTTVP